MAKRTQPEAESTGGQPSAVRGLVSTARAPTVETTFAAPPAALADVVDRLWAGRWTFDGAAEPEHTTELLSDPCANIVFELSSVSDTRLVEISPPDNARLVGVWTRLWTRTLNGDGMVRGAKLKAGAIRAFFDVDAHRVSNRITPLSELVAGSDDAREDVLASRSHEDGFAHLSIWLQAARRQDDREDVSLAVAIGDRIRADENITSTAALVDVVGLSVRPLQRLFRRHVGASPKWVIRRYRLQEVADRIRAGQAENFARLAADLGYTDQAHLARDFKQAVGKSPSAHREAVDAANANASIRDTE